MSCGWLPNFAGASLSALIKLGRKKGYRLVGTNGLAFNALFVRDDLLADIVPTVSADSCLMHVRVLWSIENRSKTVEHLPWQDF